MKPLNTDEQYLYAIANGKPEKLKPANRKEAYLKKIAEFHARGGSGGGIDGKDGKSAYEQAVEGGYTGTEAEFKQALASIETMTKAEMLEILRGGELS